MKPILHGLLVLVFSLLLSALAWEGQASEKPEKLLGAMSFLPADDDIPGWKRSGKLLSASNGEELYKIVNGGATLYIQHGFQSFVGQSYKGPKGVELEVYIFNQGTPQNAQDLYENPFAKPGHGKEIPDLGEKARIDTTPLFSLGVDFVQKGFFVRVMIQDKTEEGLKVALSFAHKISKRIDTKMSRQSRIPADPGHKEGGGATIWAAPDNSSVASSTPGLEAPNFFDRILPNS